MKVIKKPVFVLTIMAFLSITLLPLGASALSTTNNLSIQGNLLTNPGFEETQDAGANDGNAFVRWISDSMPVEDSWTACFPSGEAIEGKTAATSWCAVGYTLTISQEVEVPEAGKYDAGIWISRGPANQGEAVLNIKSGDDVIASAKIDAKPDNDYHEYRLLKIDNFEIPSAGKYTFELVSITSGNSTAEGFNNNPYTRVDGAYLKPIAIVGEDAEEGDEEEVKPEETKPETTEPEVTKPETTSEGAGVKTDEAKEEKNPATEDSGYFTIILYSVILLISAIVIFLVLHHKKSRA